MCSHIFAFAEFAVKQLLNTAVMSFHLLSPISVAFLVTPCRPATSAKQRSQPAALPASKKAKAHIAFGTRCDPPRPAAVRGAKVVKLNASPPELPKPNVSKAVQHEAGEAQHRL